MKYKDLIYKITSKNPTNPTKSKDIKNDKLDINSAKKSLITKDILIGIIVDESSELTPGMLQTLKREIERTLTVLFNSPISDTFSFLPYSFKSLKIVSDTFPEKNLHYISGRDEFNDVKDLKKDKLNISKVYPSLKKKEDFVKKINYLVTINHTLEPTMEAALKTNDIMVFPMEFRGTETFSQKEKLVAPDPSGWSYNSASGMWVKNWGWDGQQELQGW